MLHDIESGYEGKFDFPPRAGPPPITYLLASLPRAGSTHFSHLLWRTGCLGAPLEYLNFLPLSPYGFASSSAPLQTELWHSVLRRRCSPNGVFGLKAFPQQLDELQDKNPQLLEEVLGTLFPRQGPRRIIYLRRRDRIAQAVSYARANMSGVWNRQQESQGSERIEYSQETVESAERGIEVLEDVWARMFRDLRIEPLNLWHEDVLADPSGASRQVAGYLGTSIDPAAAVKAPEVRKQSTGDSAMWIERYASSRAVTPQSSS